MRAKASSGPLEAAGNETTVLAGREGDKILELEERNMETH